MWTALAVLLTGLLVAANVWRAKRWRKKHETDPAPPAPMIDGVSAFTGEVIASGQPNTELGDGAPPPCSAP
jgi:hypothetical protein